MKLSIIATVMFLTACSSKRDYHQLTEQVAEYGIQRIEDTKHNVLCYVYRDNDSNSMSCVKNQKKDHFK